MLSDELTPPERVLWDAFPRGETVDLSGGDQDFDSTNAWGPERTIRAEVISALLLGARENEPGHVAAVRLTGARIAGTLNLGHAHVTVPLALTGCQLTEAPHLYWAQLRSVHFMRCRLPGLVASGARIDGHLWLEGSHVYGGVWLDSAHITGILNLTGAHLSHPGGDAPLLADRLVVDNNVYCDQGFTAEGEVRLPGANVGGQLIFRGARLRNPKGQALYASRLAVAANVFCDGGFSAEGEIRLRGARIGGYLSLVGASVSNPARAALNCDDMSIETDIYCSDGFRAEGVVSLAGAHIGGLFNLRGGRLSNPAGVALNLQRAQAEEVLLRPAEPIKGVVDLSYAHFKLLRDDPLSWAPRYQLDGLTYEMIDPPLIAKERLKWVRRDTDGYIPQPYEKLAETYRALGHDGERRTVLLAKQRHRRTTQPVPGRVWGYLQDWTVGYGYRPFLATAWLVALLAFGTVIFQHHPMIQEPGHNTQFNPFLYTLDVLLPIGSLGQEGEFAPHGIYLWISDALVVAGFILGLTVAAGATRVLSRE
ncbi:oxidoreductase [Actinoallomurus vinaceus]|uniref:Oxidoreductase n=1 Tax=Actinoallomurus vinaceus TaxID=1080074 RepID=A0ABP8UF25_9ACTN